MNLEPGLRERKKRRTRRLIADAARRLFAERGFDAVAVAEVARVADVSEATVFNYFPTKEDLVYQGMEVFEEELLDAIRARAAGEPVVTAFGRFVLQVRGLLAEGDAAAARELMLVSRTIATSPALLARERAILARYTDALAALLAEETGAAADDIAPWVLANALVGVHAALIAYVRRRLLDGPLDLPRLASDVRVQGERALALLEHGLRGYAPKQPSASKPSLDRRRRSTPGVTARAGPR